MKSYRVFINTKDAGSFKTTHATHAARLAMEKGGIQQASMIEVQYTDNDGFYTQLIMFNVEIQNSWLVYSQAV